MQELKQNLVIVSLILLAVVEISSVSFIMPNKPAGKNIAQAPVQKLSEIRGARIDDEAATIVIEESAETATQGGKCSTLPMDIWIFLLIAYGALLIFNFSYTFERATAPQWAWEAGLTALALIAWYAWDECRTNVWFPLMVVKLGLLVFIAYVHLLEKKLWANNEKTGSLF